MPWSGAPSTVPADAVRLLVGDTTTASPLLPDDAYVFFIAQEPNVYARAALAADALAAKYAPEMDKRIGDLWRSAKVIFTHYAALAARFRIEAMRRGRPSAWAGGISVADVATRNDDTDRVLPSFIIGMQDAIEPNPKLEDE